jgi:hypothetical protein
MLETGMCQYITMWPADVSYWPTYRTSGDTRVWKQEDMVTDISAEWMTVTADDGSHADVSPARRCDPRVAFQSVLMKTTRVVSFAQFGPGLLV